jgi:hypothetical protein
VQRDALGKVKKDEELKRQQGKGKWFLKKGKRLYMIFQVIYLTCGAQLIKSSL